MPDGKSTACNTCGPDTTPCTIPQQTGYPQNGLNGAGWNGFSQTGVDQNGNPYTAQSVNLINGNYYVEQYLKMFSNNTLPLFKTYLTNYPTIAQLLFNYDEYLDPTVSSTQPIQNFSFKTFPTISPELAQEGNYFNWTEWQYEQPNVYVVKDEAAPTNQILIGDKNGNPINTQSSDLRFRNLYKIGDTITIKSNDPQSAGADCCNLFVTRTITNVEYGIMFAGPHGNLPYMRLTLETGDLPLLTFKGYNAAPNNIIPERNTPDYTYPGDEVQYAFHGRNDCDLIDNESPVIPYKSRYSYIQHVSATLYMKKGDLNKSFASENGVMDYLNQKMYGQKNQLIRDIANTFYIGRNRKSNLMMTNNRAVPQETQGLLPMIWDAHLKNPDRGIVKNCSKMTTDDEKVRALYDMIVGVQNARVMKAGAPVTLICDTIAMAELHKLNAAFNRFTGMFPITQDNVNKTFQLPMIRTTLGSVEMLHCQALSDITKGNKTGTIIAMSKELVALKTRENQEFKFAQGTIQKSTQGFIIEDVTLPGQHECRKYDIFTEMSIIFGLAESGGYRMLTGFGKLI